jgi:sphinganine-1-phosphate aldolase
MPNLSVALNVVGEVFSTTDNWARQMAAQYYSSTQAAADEPYHDGPQSLQDFINYQLAEYAPTTLILGTVAATVGAYYALQAAQKAQALYREVQFSSTSQMKKLLIDKTVEFLSDKPYFGPKIQASIKKKVDPLLAKIGADLNKTRRELGPTLQCLPAEAKSSAEILKIAAQANKHYHPGRASGTLYARPNPEREKMIDEVYSYTKLTNAMHAEEFPDVRKMTAEVISWCQNLFQGSVDTENYKFPGMITDGGTSSIFEAVSAYANYARDKKDIQNPEIVVPETVHVAFENAAKRCNVKLIKVPVNPETGGADVAKMERAITGNTCLVVGSAPSFPCGVIDPMPELAAMAAKHHIPVHVDACLGGFLTAFAKKAGYDLPPCDFSVPNVMSISTDPHKYGQTPKGSSVLLFHPNAPASPIYTNLEWYGGMYVAEGMKGSRPGYIAATTWATMLSFGEEGYVEETKRILDFTQQLTVAIKNIPGMLVPYDPKTSVITLNTDEGINASLVASLMKKKHWGLNIIQGGGFHFCVTALHESMQDMILNDFIGDLTEAVAYAKANPKEKPQGLEGVYGQLDEIPGFVQHRVGEAYAAMTNSLSPSLYAIEAKQEANRLKM